MHTHNNPGDDQDAVNAVVIPLPRKAPDNDIANLPRTGSDQPVWWYGQLRKRGGDRRYSGHINHSHGTEAEQARAQLADVIRELLDWAAHQQSGDHSIEDGEAA